MIIKFVEFLLSKVFNPVIIPEKYILEALEKTVLDTRYHFPDTTSETIVKNIISNSNELGVFLYRLGSVCREKDFREALPQLHWLLKECCSCEIYFNTTIDEGFYIVHGEGTVIGSRNKIGKGFKIYQGATIGHRRNNPAEEGATIADNVTLFANSSIIGPVFVGGGAK